MDRDVYLALPPALLPHLRLSETGQCVGWRAGWELADAGKFGLHSKLTEMTITILRNFSLW